MTPLQCALAYAARGWRVVPAPKGMKRPVIYDWQNKATTDTDTIRAWWESVPDQNVCIATGQASSLWVIDVDDKNDAGGSAAIAALESEHGDLPGTYTVGTGSEGVHHYFTWEGVGWDLRNSAGKLGPGLDTRGNGGQVVAPPSESETGPYITLLDTPPVPAPKWLTWLLRPKTVTPVRDTRPAPTGDVGGILRWLSGVQPGGQDNSLAWVVRVLRDETKTEAEARHTLRDVVTHWPCSRDPWTDRDIERQIRSAYK